MFRTEINRGRIEIIRLIGEGHFGDVYLGNMSINGTSINVAVKSPKENATNEDLADFLIEASTMGQFKHPNVITLLGVVTASRMIVTEFMENGSLDNYLMEHIGQLTMLCQLKMMCDIASGMLYLSRMNYVHRDLAARNILVDSSLCCKVADFGLSRFKNVIGAYMSQGVTFPTRWTAPEAISNGEFTSASDVWSFGIVMWEIMSYGKRPYGDYSDEFVMIGVPKGYRLRPPFACPANIYQLMFKCWHAKKHSRPSFSAINQELKGLKDGKENAGSCIPF